LLAPGTYIMVLFFKHIPFVVNHTINATPPERLQYSQVPIDFDFPSFFVKPILSNTCWLPVFFQLPVVHSHHVIACTFYVRHGTYRYL